MSESSIEWTEHTWNPVRGCSRVSPGCDNCYAMRQARRTHGPGGAYEGLTVMRPKTAKRPGVDWSGVVRLVPELLAVPLRRRVPTVYFVNSMSDLFHERLRNEAIAAVFGVMAACPQHTFQVLTKRAKRMREWFEWYEGDSGAGASPIAAVHAALDRMPATVTWNVGSHRVLRAREAPWPLPNVHLGVSCENQAAADERLPYLRATPAAVRWVSAEPLLGSLSLDLSGIHWVVAGGESGPGARACDVQWLRHLRDQCHLADVPFFNKQLGSRPTIDGTSFDLQHTKGGEPSEWFEDLRVREMPS